MTLTGTIGGTNVPAISWGPQGFIAPEETDILAGVQQDINIAFGGNLNFSTTGNSVTNPTPQGQLSQSETAVLGYVNDVFVYYTNQTDPMYAEGRMQDAIGRIYFLERNPALPTTVNALCIGLEGVYIPVGALIQAVDGNTYICTGSGTIPASGQITLPFACTTVGPIPCPVGALTTIYSAIPGWDTVSNPTEGVLGQYVESRAHFEQRRALSVAHNAMGSLPSVLGAVLDVNGVLDAFVTENTLDTVTSIGGVVLAPHSIYVAVSGGAPADIGRAIWTKKAPGCGYNGNTTVTVEDLSPTYRPPYPAYQVSYQVPYSLAVVFNVTLANVTGIPSNAETLIEDVIISAFAGEDGGPRASIGAGFYASRYYCGIRDLGTWSNIITIKVGCANTAAARCEGYLSGTVGGSGVMTVVSMTSGTLGAGQTLQGSGVISGTIIFSQVSGSLGGTGVYLVDKSMDLTQRTLYGVVADQDDFSVRIDQVPTVSAEDIHIILVVAPS